PDDVPDLIPAIDGCRNGAEVSREFRVVLPDGGIRRLYGRARMERDKHGRPTCLVGACTDLARRKEAEAAVVEARARVEGIISRALLGIAQVDASGRFVLVNEQYCRILNRAEDDVIGRTMQEFTHPADLPGNLAAWRNMMATGAPFSIEKRYIRPDGSHVWVNVNVSVTQTVAGKPRYVVAIVQDVTARRRAEEELRALNDQLEERVTKEVAAREQAQARLAHSQRMEALGQLAGGIAHDFNNVLQAVMGGLALIERRPEAGERIRQLARMALDASERGKAITSRLLAFARRGELRSTVVEPRPLLDGVAEILGSTLGAAITVRVRAEPDVPALFADRTQLETVLINLSVNARDAMPAGGDLTLSAYPVEIADGDKQPDGPPAGRYVRLDVSDTGVGMDALMLVHAAEPFFTTKPVGQGTGLGLPMARGFALQSRGSFAIKCLPGAGTTISLWFPRAVAPAHTDAGPPPCSASGRRACTLVVDDDPMVRTILAAQLQALGHGVVEASDGLAALALLDSGEKPDVLVTDYSMPGMNGLMLINEARLRLPDLPAVLLTGFADTRLRDMEFAGNDRAVLLRKPVAQDMLGDSIAALLGGAAAG
ncbi:MAG: PAS domain S-box protein, partial [Acetobacteraceae bacterium]